MNDKPKERRELRIKLLELGGAISSCWEHTAGGKFDQERAEREVDAATDAILAAGYRKYQVARTVEELRAVPEGSVIMTGGGRVMRFGIGASSTGSDYIAELLPAMVLYEPETTK